MTIESILKRLKAATRIFTDSNFTFTVGATDWEVETYNGRIVGLGTWYNDEPQMRNKEGNDSPENYAKFMMENSK